MEVARAYLEAFRDRRIDRCVSLFDPSSSVFEGEAQGSFERYARVHLAPELEQARGIALNLDRPEVSLSEAGDLALVEWPIQRLTVQALDDRVFEGPGAATFVLTRTQGPWRIRHLHWSTHLIESTRSAGL
ncbi:MAG: nuclear transport factor 2 family protein [Sandaracinaceae bacterium]|nr:nuclear transport factor 2 family protein [Sandaracinaceae bacterium]